MAIPKHTVDQIRQASDIIDIISDVVLLKKTGKDFTGLCPFHSEKTPSFTVSPDKQIFHCFGCGEGGDVFSFLMKYQRIPFVEAVQGLARRYGIPVSESPTGKIENRPVDPKEILFEINRLAADFYHDVLLNHELGKPALQYLMNRGVPLDIIKTFLLGFSPDSWDGLTGHFRRHRIDPVMGEKSGLIIPRKGGNGYFDRFRNRVMFPIHDGHSRIIGMGGRVMDDSKPKYMNSPETLIYQKSRSLYGLNRARTMCRQTGSVFITEGYMDLLAMHTHGLYNTIATLGTAMTGEHIRILKGLASRMILVYDSDQAGIQAASRCIDLFKTEKRYDDIRILVLPKGHDPDTYLNEFGSDEFRKAAAGAMSVFSFLTDMAIIKHGLSPNGKVHVIDDMEQQLASLESVDGLIRLTAIRELSEKTGIPEAAIQDRIRRSSATIRHSGKSRPVPAKPFSRLDRHAVMMMIQVPEIVSEIHRKCVLDCFDDPVLKRIGERIISVCRSCRTISSSELASVMMENSDDPIERRLVGELSIIHQEWTDEACQKLISQYEKKRKHDLNAMWIRKIKSAEADQNDQMLCQLLKDAQSALISSGGE
jgi:DNA primase